MEVSFEGEFIFKSVGLVRVGSNLSGLVIEDEEKTCIDVVFVEMDAFQFVPEITLIANEIPAKFLLIKTEIGEMLIIAPLNGLKFLFSLHFLFLWEGKNVGDLSFIIIKCSKQLSTGILVFEFISMTKNLYVDDRADVYFLQFEIQSHVLS